MENQTEHTYEVEYFKDGAITIYTKGEKGLISAVSLIPLQEDIIKERLSLEEYKHLKENYRTPEIIKAWEDKQKELAETMNP